MAGEPEHSKRRGRSSVLHVSDIQNLELLYNSSSRSSRSSRVVVGVVVMVESGPGESLFGRDKRGNLTGERGISGGDFI